MRLETNGASLNVEVQGSGPPLMLLHGFTGCGRTWAPFLGPWAGFKTIAVDLLGHGKSDSPSEAGRYDMQACLDDLGAVLDAIGVEKPALLGYSLGGRIALNFALRYPDRLSLLILESASPGIADPAERARRRQEDEELAVRIESDGIEAFVDYWQRLPLWASQAIQPLARREALRRQRLQNSAAGLANSLRGVGAGACVPLFERLSEIEVPILAIAGVLDARYVALARSICHSVPHADLEIVENAGHATHFEQPEVFGKRVRAFLVSALATKI